MRSEHNTGLQRWEDNMTMGAMLLCVVVSMFFLFAAYTDVV